MLRKVLIVGGLILLVAIAYLCRVAELKLEAERSGGGIHYAPVRRDDRTDRP